jgi:hypothetical protein
VIRYLGHKPFNWPAAVLIFGWMGLGLVVGLGVNVAELSPFHWFLPPGVLVWRPEMSPVGLALFIVPMLLGGLACWLVPFSGYSRSISLGLVGSGILAFAVGMAWEAGAGVAIYPDRIIYRSSGIGVPLRTERFADIQRVETACSSYRRRRSSSWQINPIYEVVFASGYSTDVWRGAGTLRGNQRTNVIDTVRMIDRQARAAGATRAPARKPDGTLIGSAGCLDRLAENLLIGRGDLDALFQIDQSELKEHEYSARPTDN